MANEVCADDRTNVMIYRIFLIVIFSFIGVSLVAKETPQSLAKKLQDQFLAAKEVSMGFDLRNEGRVNVTVDLQNKRIRIESPSLIFISDSHTIWNYQKDEDRVTIDNVTGSSAFQDPENLFRFQDNYSASITKIIGANGYILELVPKPILQQLLKSAGEIQKIILEIKANKQAIQILNATAASSKVSTRAEKLTIKTLGRTKDQDFIYKPKSTTKVIDLRE